MSRRRAWGVGAAATAATLLLAACGSGNPDSAKSESRPSAAPPTVSGIDCAKEGKVPGSGSTAQYNAVKHWIREYQRACKGVQFRYLPLGSGGGVAQFLRGATAFGGTDSPLKPSEVEASKDICGTGKAINLPLLGGPVAIGYHLSGVDDLVLDAPTLAKIFDSRIKRWDDPAIKKLNPDAELPDLPIRAVHRSDASGTTQNLNGYLAGAAPAQWPYPESKAWHAKGGHSAPGAEGVAEEVSVTDGAIGYFELSSAAATDVKTVKIDTGADEPVAASTEAASAGIAAADVIGKGKDMTLRFDHDTKEAGAYPIVQVTYEVVCDTGNREDTLPALKSFLAYAAGEQGQKILPGLHYARLPDDVAGQVREVVGSLS